MVIQAIFGLGNPLQYNEQRHNVGVWLVDYLAKVNNCKFQGSKKIYGSFCSYKFEEYKIYLIKSELFMNENGLTVSAFLRFFKIDSNKLLIAHDELDFQTGKVRLKFSGGSGGHNGIKDIITKLGTTDFYRMRIGIGKPEYKSMVKDYVLSNPDKIEKDIIMNSIIYSARSIEILFNDFNKAMNFLHK